MKICYDDFYFTDDDEKEWLYSNPKSEDDYFMDLSEELITRKNKKLEIKAYFIEPKTINNPKFIYKPEFL